MKIILKERNKKRFSDLEIGTAFTSPSSNMIGVKITHKDYVVIRDDSALATTLEAASLNPFVIPVFIESITLIER